MSSTQQDIICSVWHPIRNYKQTGKYHPEWDKSTEANPEMTQMKKVVDKNRIHYNYILYVQEDRQMTSFT